MWHLCFYCECGKLSFVSITMIIVNCLTLLYIFARLFKDSYLHSVFSSFYFGSPLSLPRSHTVISLLLYKKLQQHYYCCWLEPLPLKIFIFSVSLSAVFLHFHFLYFKELSLYVWYSDRIYLLKMNIYAPWIMASD